MARAPGRFVGWLADNGYHPRSNKHGVALCKYTLDDLLEHSEFLKDAKEHGILAYDENHDIVFEARDTGYGTGELTWNVDLVIGLLLEPEENGKLVKTKKIAQYLFAMDAKGIMTEHGKARRNRQRDLVAFSQVMRAFCPDIITAGAVPINAAKRFDSPLRSAPPKPHPHNIDKLVDGCISLFRAVRVIETSSGLNAVDAVGTFVIDFDNTEPFKPKLTGHKINDEQSEDLVSFSNFLSTICDLLDERFSQETE